MGLWAFLNKGIHPLFARWESKVCLCRRIIFQLFLLYVGRIKSSELFQMFWIYE